MNQAFLQRSDDSACNIDLEEDAPVQIVKTEPFRKKSIVKQRWGTSQRPSVVSYSSSAIVNKRGKNNLKLVPPKINMELASGRSSPVNAETFLGDRFEVNHSGFTSEELGSMENLEMPKETLNFNQKTNSKSFIEFSEFHDRELIIKTLPAKIGRDLGCGYSVGNSPFSSHQTNGEQKSHIDKNTSDGNLLSQNVTATELPRKIENREATNFEDMQDYETLSEELNQTQRQALTRNNFPVFNRQNIKLAKAQDVDRLNIIEGLKKQNINFSRSTNFNETFRPPSDLNLHTTVLRQKRKESSGVQSGINNLVLRSEEELDPSKQLLKAIFSHDIQMIERILDQNPNLELNVPDGLGNTPLMLAAKLSFRHLEYFEIIQILLEKGADPRIRDKSGWSCVDEAVSQSDAMLLSLLFDHLTLLKQRLIKEQQENMIKALHTMPNFYLEMKWDFESSVLPFISKLAPSDTFKIWKFGNYVRMDNTLVSMKKLKTKRRNMSLIFNPDIEMPTGCNACASLYSLNRTNQTYTNIMENIDIEEKKHIMCDLMKADPLQGTFNIKECHWTESKGFFGNDVTYKISEYDTKKYDFKITMEYVVFKKSQSLFKDTYQSYIEVDFILNTSSFFKKLQSGGTGKNSLVDTQNPQALLSELRHRNGVHDKSSAKADEKSISINSPKRKNLQEVLNFENLRHKSGDAETLENAQVKEKKATASLWLARDFPLKLKDLLQTIQFLSKGNDLLQKMDSLLSREEIKALTLDGSFPMKLQLPVTLAIKANITITKYEPIKDINCKEIFFVPGNFKHLQRKLAQKTPQRRKKRLLLFNILA